MSVSYSNNSYCRMPNYKDDVKGGGFGALLGAAGVSAVPQFISPVILKRMKEAHKVSEHDALAMKDAAQKILAETGLKNKGVEIEYITKNSPKANTKSMFANMLHDIYINMVGNGQNAFFTGNGLSFKKQEIFKRNKILAPEKELQGAVFHEIGHAHNFNSTKFLKLLQHQTARSCGKVLPLILTIYGACTKKSKTDNGSTELTSGQKTNNFIRDNAGKLSFIAAVPMLVEEASATVKGYKFSKKFIPIELAKKACKANWLGWMTYLLAALGGAIGAYTAVKLKDKHIEKKEQELKTLYEKTDWRFG